MNNKATRIVVVTLILVVATCVRFFWLSDVPAGIHPLEAEYGLQALDKSFSFMNGNLFALITSGAISIFDNNAFALRVTAGIVGILTVLGTYLLTSSLFHWRTGALASFLLATSFWHVYYSKIGLEIILIPLISVWSLYFFWQSLKKGSLAMAILAGITAGLGAYTHLAFSAMLLVYSAVIMNYLSFLSKDYVEAEYRHGMAALIKSVLTFIISAGIISAPIALHYLINSNLILNSSINLGYGDTIRNAAESIFLLYGPFVLSWPLAALAVIGLIREAINWFQRKHGHFPTTHTLVLAWLIAGLIPGFFARQSPDTFLTLNTIIPICILAGQALWWLGTKIRAWEEMAIPSMRFTKTDSAIAALAIILIAVATGAFELRKYRDLFTQTNIPGFEKYTEIADRLNAMPQKTNKYVLVNTPDSRIKYIVQYLTDTGTDAKRNERRLWYLTQEEFNNRAYDRQSVIIPLK